MSLRARRGMWILWRRWCVGIAVRLSWWSFSLVMVLLHQLVPWVRVRVRTRRPMPHVRVIRDERARQRWRMKENKWIWIVRPRRPRARYAPRQDKNASAKRGRTTIPMRILALVTRLFNSNSNRNNKVLHALHPPNEETPRSPATPTAQ